MPEDPHALIVCPNLHTIAGTFSPDSSYLDWSTSTVDETIEASDPRSEFVESEFDGLPSPAENSFRLACVATKVIPSDLGLEPSSLGTGQEVGSLANGRDELFRENVHRAPNGFKGMASMMKESSVSISAELGTTLSDQ
jgi:hypothetical protein